MPDIKLGAVDRSVLVFVPDAASTDGSGKTGLVAANLTVSYTRVETDNDVVVTDVTSSLSNLSALTDAHADWGLKEVSSTLAPGLYRLDIADAVFASGAWYAVVYVMITSSAAAASPILFTLIAFDPLDAVRLGLTALPNAAADAAGGLIVSDSGGLDADAQRADVVAILVDTGTTLQGEVDGIQADTEDIQTRLPAALVSGRIDSSVGAMAANVMTAASAAADLTTELQSGLATAAALTVVDGIVDDILVDTSTTLQGELDGIQARLSPIDTLIGAVITDGGNSATSFKTDLTAPATDHYKDAFLKITSGALENQLREITGSTGTIDAVLTVAALTATPADGVTFEIVND